MPDRIHDVIVAGAGPAGSRTARELARRGFDVVVLEEHSAVGVPCHCSGLVSPRTLRLSEVGDAIILNTVRGAVIHLPGAAAVTFAGDRVHAHVVDRVSLDRLLLHQAMVAGAQVRLSTQLLNFETRSDAVAVRVRRAGKETRLLTRLLIGADGARSRVASQLSGRAKAGMVVGLGAVAAYDRSPLPDHVEVFIDPDSAPGWFGWTIPLRAGRARVGTGSANGITPRQSFRRLQRAFPQSFGAAQVESTSGGWIPLWRPGPLVGDRTMLVGDAARQVKPASGGGIYAALTAASIAAPIASASLESDDLSLASLRQYETAWTAGPGREMKRQHDLRRVYERLTARELRTVLRLLGNGRVRAAIGAAADIDFASDAGTTALHGAPTLRDLLTRTLRFPEAWKSHERPLLSSGKVREDS